MKKSFVIVILLFTVGSFSVIWAQENQLTVDECVQIALENNADLVRGEFILKMAGKDVTVAFSNFLPRVSTSMGYTHSVAGPRSIFRIDPTTGILVPTTKAEEASWWSSARISVSQSIFEGGYNIFNYTRNRHLKKSAEYTFENTKQTTIYVVKERYYNLLAAEKLSEVAEETIKSSEESYKRAQVLFDVGKVPKSDVLKAKVQLETDKLTLIEAQNSLAIARASLNHVLGFDVDRKIQVVDNLDVPEIVVSYEDAVKNAFTFHPSLMKGMYDVKASKSDIGMAVSQYLPSLSAYYSYNWSHRDFEQIKNIFDKDYNWYAGFSLSLPIFQGFSRVANLSKARLNHKSNLEAMEQTKRDVALEVKQAYFEVEQAKKKIAVTRNAVEAAEEDLRLNKEKYSLGAGTMLDLINAQVSYTEAKSENIQALYNYKYTIARLQKAMGKLEK